MNKKKDSNVISSNMLLLYYVIAAIVFGAIGYYIYGLIEKKVENPYTLMTINIGITLVVYLISFFLIIRKKLLAKGELDIFKNKLLLLINAVGFVSLAYVIYDYYKYQAEYYVLDLIYKRNYLVTAIVANVIGKFIIPIVLIIILIKKLGKEHK